jgi:RNA polymerase sigma-70 factor (ECF subfamily)
LENEAGLVAEARTSNGEAFATLIQYYDRHLHWLALNITGNQEDAETVLQEVFSKAYGSLDQLPESSDFHTWLLRITASEIVRNLRQRHGDGIVSLDESATSESELGLPQEVDDWGDHPQERYGKSELQAILHEAIQGLEVPFRLVVGLRDIANLSSEETAELLGFPVPAVRSQLLLGRLKLRERLNRYFKSVEAQRK